jgi:hypothetical protein
MPGPDISLPFSVLCSALPPRCDPQALRLEQAVTIVTVKTPRPQGAPSEGLPGCRRSALSRTLRQMWGGSEAPGSLPGPLASPALLRRR